MTDTRTIASIQEEIMRLKAELIEARRASAPEPVDDHALKRTDGSTVHLSELFDDKRDLLVVHNMGKGCAYCTIWADGLNGFTDHLQSRTAIALVSADPPRVAGEFAESRNWRIPVLSGNGSEFTRAMGFLTDDGVQPGVSAFHLNDDGSIVRTGFDSFGPGDDYCAPFPLFDLLEGGIGSWEPKLSYES